MEGFASERRLWRQPCPAAGLITRYILKWWLLFKFFRICFLFFESFIHTHMLFRSNNSSIASLHLLPCSHHPLPFLDPLWAACMYIIVGPLATVSVASLGLYPWRKLPLSLPAASSYQQLFSYRWEVMTPFPFHTGIWVDLVLCRYYAYSPSLCAFMCMTSLFCPANSVLMQVSTLSGSYSLSLSSSSVTSEPWGTG